MLCYGSVKDIKYIELATVLQREQHIFNINIKQFVLLFQCYFFITHTPVD